LCDAQPGISGAWGPDGTIVFSAAAATALRKVSASGGVPTPVTALEGDETGHARPAFLPDGRHFVYRAIIRPESPRGLAFIGSLDTSERTRLMGDVDSTNVVHSQGHLLFLRERTLMAQPFDADRLAVAGEPFPIAEDIQSFAAYGFFSASDSGVLTYQSGSSPAGAPQLAWLDRAGNTVATVGQPAVYGDLALAPDGRRAAVRLLAGQTVNDLWLLDLARDGLATRFTFDRAIEMSPVWSPAADRVVFSSTRRGNADLYQKAASGAGNEEVLLAMEESEIASSWSGDGRYLLYVRTPQPGGSDLWVLPMAGDGKPFAFLQTAADETQAQFSPDGQWIAYQSNESGRAEVYVSRFTESGSAGGKWQISTNGGTLPRWRPDGKEIFFVAPLPDAQVMAAAVSSQNDTFNVGATTPLFRALPPGTPGSFYQISPDGMQFLFNMSPTIQPMSTPITVVLNWTAALKK
jgi:Tol biopolymer transport system component